VAALVQRGRLFALALIPATLDLDDAGGQIHVLAMQCHQQTQTCVQAVGGTPTAWAMASRTRAQIRKLHETTTSVKPVMQPDGPAGASPSTLFGVPIYHGNQVSITDAPGTATAVHLFAPGRARLRQPPEPGGRGRPLPALQLRPLGDPGEAAR